MFDRVKRWMQERLEKGAIKSELDGEIVYLKKSNMPLIGDWGRIYPPINEDGTINWVNFIFGGYKNLIKLIILVAIIGMVLFQFMELFNYIEAIQSHQCYNAFSACMNQTSNLPSLIR